MYDLTAEQVIELVRRTAAQRIEHAEALMVLWKDESRNMSFIRYHTKRFNESQREWQKLQRMYGDQFPFGTIEQEAKRNHQDELFDELYILRPLSSSAADMVVECIGVLKK